MSERLEFCLSGSGGQGLITAGIIFAEAALLDGKNAIQSQSYGPEARGGASKAEVIISDDPIDYPKTIEPMYVLCLTKESYEKFGVECVDCVSSIIILDASIDIPKSDRFIVLPILETAMAELKPIVANAISLGVLGSISEVVSKESLEKALLARVPKGTEELNKKALYRGYRLVEELVPLSQL